MTIRVGSWGKGDARITAWRQGERTTFTFQKAFYDKRSQSYKSSNTLFARELYEIGQAFLQAAEWAKKHVPITEATAPIMPTAASVVGQILATMGVKQ